MCVMSCINIWYDLGMFLVGNISLFEVCDQENEIRGHL